MHIHPSSFWDFLLWRCLGLSLILRRCFGFLGALCFFCFAFFLWKGGDALAKKTIVSEGCERSQKKLRLFLVKTLPHTPSFSSVQSLAKSSSVRLLEADFFRPPQKNRVYWLRGHFQAPKDARAWGDWVLRIRHDGLEKVVVYLPFEKNKTRIWKSRTLRPYETDGWSVQSIFPFHLEACKEIDFYVQLLTAQSSHWSGELVFRVSAQKEWIWRHDLFRLLCGVYFGVIFGLLVVQFFLYLWLRDDTAKWFVLYHTSLIFFILGGNGLLHPFFDAIQLSHIWGFRLRELLLGFFILWAMFYTRSFLQTWLIPKVDRLLLLYIGLVGGYLVCVPWAPPAFVGGYSQILGLLSPIATIVPGWVFWRRGFPPALIYLLAWGLFSIASFLFAAPCWNDWGFFIFQTGSGCSAILLSLAMVQRLRLLREERERAEVQALQSEKMATLGQLVAGVAHEINNPANFITFNLPILRQYIEAMSPYVEAVKEEQPKKKILRMSIDEFLADAHTLLENMEHGASRITRIVDDLRGYVKRQEAEQPVQIEISSVVRSVLLLVGKQVSQQVERVDVEIEPALPSILWREGKLDQVFINLLLNAAQAAKPEGSWIKLRAQRHPHKEEWLLITVEDNGVGISTAQKENIFAPFFTTKGREANMGLGLSISRRIAEEHGGTLTVESAEGQGACFLLSLPLGGTKR